MTPQCTSEEEFETKTFRGDKDNVLRLFVELCSTIVQLILCTRWLSWLTCYDVDIVWLHMFIVISKSL